MGDYGIKVSKDGAEVTSTDPRDLLMSSKYPMLKYHDIQTGSFTFTPGDTDAYADVSHSLGYVPAFIAYMQDLDDTSKLVFMMGPPSTGFGIAPWSYSDSSKIRVGMALIGFTYNYYDNRVGSPSPPDVDMWNTYAETGLGMSIGNIGGTRVHGAFRVAEVDIAQGTTITEAILHIAVQGKGAGVGDLKAKIWGIDEDNTAAFSSSPMSRTKTSAVDTANWSLPAEGNYSDHNITSLVQEIISRAGWVAGNAMGFIIEDDVSPTDVNVIDILATGINSYLTIKYGSNTTLNFKVIIFKDKIA